ncbi:hypothetical protein Tco_0970489 [Tanacetum coccineum]
MTKTSTGLAKQASHGKKPQQSEPQNDVGSCPIPDFTTPVPTTAVVTPRTDNPPPALPRVLQSELNEADLVLEGVALGMEPSAFVTRNYESLTSLLATETRRRSSRDLQSRLNFGLDNDITRDSEEESRTRKRFKQRRRLTDQHKRPPVFDRLGNRIPGPQLEANQEFYNNTNPGKAGLPLGDIGAPQAEVPQVQAPAAITRDAAKGSGQTPCSEQDSSDGGDRNPRHQKSRRTNNSEEDMSLPWHRQKADAFVKRIKNYLDNIKRRLPSHVKTYEELNNSDMFTDEHALDYSSPPLWDDYDDELFDLKTCDSLFYEDFSEVDALPSTDNEDKVFNPGILIHENLFEVTNCATLEKNVKKTTNASLILEDFNPPLYELPFHKEVPRLGALLSFSSENEERVFNPGILTSKRVHTSLLPELSHRGPKAFKVIKIFESPVEIFPCSYGEDIRILDILDVLYLHFYPP